MTNTGNLGHIANIRAINESHWKVLDYNEFNPLKHLLFRDAHSKNVTTDATIVAVVGDLIASVVLHY
jgi:hypothetical protein